MNIVFEKIKIQNFLSIGSEPLEIEFDKGIHFITGINKDNNSRNGVGKTSIVASLFFALYGEIDRKITKTNIANYLNTDTCVVDLSFSINDTKYRIIRSLRPSKLHLYVNGEDKSKTIPETDLEILKILGNTNKELFEQTVVMSSNKALPFLAQKNQDKVEFIEGILSLGFFGDLLDKARKKYNTKDKELTASDTKTKTLLAQYETQKSSYKSFEESKNNDILLVEKEKLTIQEKINSLRKEHNDNIIENLTKQKVELLEKIDEITKITGFLIVDIEKEIGELNIAFQKSSNEDDNDFSEQQKQKDEFYEKLRTIEQKEDNANKIRNSIISELAEIRASIQQKDKEIYKLNETKTHCPTCKQPYKDLDPSHLENCKKQIEDEKSKLKEDESKVLEKESDFNTKFEKLKLIKRETNKKIQDIDKEIAEIRQQKAKRLQEIQAEINNKRTEIDTIRKSEKSEKYDCEQKIVKIDNDISNASNKELEIKNYENRLLEKDKDIEKIKEKENPFKKIILDMREEIKDSKSLLEKLKREKTVLENVKYVVSPEGLKSFIIKKIIRLFNQRLDFYLKRLNAPCTCIFNEFFEETIYNFKGQEITYANLSGGERKRLDVAMLFTFRDIRKQQTGITFNLSIFDEIFDSAIDSSGMDKIMSILNDYVTSNDESFYIVTHRKENVDYDNVKVIELVKENGLTKLLN